MAKKIIILSVLIALLGIGGILFFINLSQTTDVSMIDCDTSPEEQLRIINNLDGIWQDLEKGISVRPILGSTGNPWQLPSHYQFIGNNRLLIAFEDGHIVVMALVEYDCQEESFSLLTDGLNQPDGFPFSNEDSWREIIETYGAKEYDVVNYFKLGDPEGHYIIYRKEENIFIR